MPWFVNSRSNVHENAVPRCMPYSHILTIRHGIGMGIVWEAYHKGVPLLGVPENPPLILNIRHVGMSLINYQHFVSIRSKIPLKIPAKPTSKDEDLDIPKHPCCSRKASTNPPKW